jgi:hypothetical protein
MLHICLEMSFILVACWTFIFFPFSFSKFQALLKFSYISSAVAPPILAKAIWFSKSIIASINVTILKDVRALTMLEAVLPLTFVAITILPRVDAVAFNLAVFPLPNIIVAFKSLPDAEAMLYAFNPLTIVYFSISPSVNPLAFRFVLDKLSNVLAGIWIQFKTSAIPLFILPFSFKNPAISVNQNAKSLSLSILQTAFIQTVFVTFDAEIFLFG